MYTLLHPAMQLKELGQMLQVKGHVEDNGTVLLHPRLHGRWDASLHATHANGSEETLFTASLPHKHPSRWVFRMLIISFEDLIPSSLQGCHYCEAGNMQAPGQRLAFYSVVWMSHLKSSK